MSVPPISSLHVAPQPTTAPAAARTHAVNATANHETGTKDSRPAQSSATAPRTGRVVDKHA